MTDNIFELEAQKRQLVHDRAKELSDIKTSYSEQLKIEGRSGMGFERRTQLRDERDSQINKVYMRYRNLLEDIDYRIRHPGAGTLTIDLSVIQAERCPLLVSAVFGESPNREVKVSRPNELREACITCISSLTLKEQGILIHRFGLDGTPTETLKEVGIRYKFTPERTRQIEAKALRKMRHPARSRRLRDYLD